MVSVASPRLEQTRLASRLWNCPIVSESFNSDTARLSCIPHSSRLPREDPFRAWCRTIGLAGLDVVDPKVAESRGFSNLVVFGEESLGVWATTVFSKFTMLIGGGRPRFRSGPLYNQVDNMTMPVPKMNYV